MSNVVIALGMQKAYFNPKGNRYLGERAETLKVRLEEYLRKLGKQDIIFYTREIHQPNDTFYRGVRSYGMVGSEDVEIPEAFKPYVKFVVNTSRHSAFYMTALESELHKIKPEKVFLVGVETHTSVLFTAEELRNRGYNVTVYESLVGAEDDYLHTLGINLLSNALSVTIE